MAGPPPKLHLPFAQWPEQDRELWTKTTATDDPFAEAPGARLEKTTLHSRWMAWRRFLGFLTLVEAEALMLSPLERVTLERVRRYAAHIAETNTPYSTACQIDAFYGAVRILLPGQNWDWLRAVKARLFVAAPPSTRGPVITSVQLLDLGVELMAEANLEDRPVGMDEAVLYRDGLIIALWAYVPLRHKNYAALEIGRDVIREADKWIIVIPAEETKTRVAIDFEIPGELQDPIETYLKRVRLRMLRQPLIKALWVSPKGGRLSYSALGPVVTRHSMARLGIRVTPHDVRDAAATTWAITAPDQIGVARDLLGHSDLRMTTKHYNRAKGIEASRAQARLIAQLRNSRTR